MKLELLIPIILKIILYMESKVLNAIFSRNILYPETRFGLRVANNGHGPVSRSNICAVIYIVSEFPEIA
jgi:hypothetical protein